MSQPNEAPPPGMRWAEIRRVDGSMYWDAVPMNGAAEGSKAIPVAGATGGSRPPWSRAQANGTVPLGVEGGADMLTLLASGRENPLLGSGGGNLPLAGAPTTGIKVAGTGGSQMPNIPPTTGHEWVQDGPTWRQVRIPDNVSSQNPRTSIASEPAKNAVPGAALPPSSAGGALPPPRVGFRWEKHMRADGTTGHIQIPIEAEKTLKSDKDLGSVTFVPAEPVPGVDEKIAVLASEVQGSGMQLEADAGNYNGDYQVSGVNALLYATEMIARNPKGGELIMGVVKWLLGAIETPPLFAPKDAQATQESEPVTAEAEVVHPAGSGG